MKVLILAGGYGTRISEETDSKPKPMVLLDEQPILWHVMNIFARQGFNDFVIATGYKGEVIHSWVNDLKTNWKIKPVDTGLDTQTGGRIRRASNHFESNEFMVTYGDGVGNINVHELLDFHKNHGKLATVTAVRPPARFGVLHSSNGLVTDFGEKSQADAGWINGGFFVLEPEVKKSIASDDEPFEDNPISKLVARRQLSAYHHEGFWKPMDTLREKLDLEKLANDLPPPWLKI